jgi:hypothetical protein
LIRFNKSRRCAQAAEPGNASGSERVARTRAR